jgi:hypothetical protein
MLHRIVTDSVKKAKLMKYRSTDLNVEQLAEQKQSSIKKTKVAAPLAGRMI